MQNLFSTTLRSYHWTTEAHFKESVPGRIQLNSLHIYIKNNLMTSLEHIDLLIIDYWMSNIW